MAQEYFFHGRILPERANVYFNIKGKKAHLADTDVELTIFCFGSQFNGTIKSEKDFATGEASTNLRAVLRSFLDRLCFAYVCAYDFDLIGVVSIPSGDSIICGVNEPVFRSSAEEQHAYSIEQIPFLPELINLDLHSVRLDHALRCFSHAMRDQALTTLFCYLAIETVARGVVEMEKQTEIVEIRASEWDIFRTVCRIRRETIDNNVKSLSDKFRHGNFVDTTWDERKRALALAWEIIRRYMFYMKTKTNLLEDHFALI